MPVRDPLNYPISNEIIFLYLEVKSSMKKKHDTLEQIIRILREADSGPFRNYELCLKHSINLYTFCRWKGNYEGMDLKEPRGLKK